MSSSTAIVFYVLLNLITSEDAARILVLAPTPSISHQIVFRPLTQELARRGHEVVIFTTDPAFEKGKAPANLTEIDMHDVSYKIWTEEFSKTVRGENDNLYRQVEISLGLFSKLVETLFQTPEVKEIINDKSKKFDLLFVETIVRPALGISHVIKAPVIQISSLGSFFESYDIIGAASHPLLYPPMTHQKLNNLTIWEKLKELYFHYSLEYLFHCQDQVDNKMLKSIFGSDIPSLSELRNNVDMLFVSVHQGFEGNQPVPPSLVHVGGMHKQPSKDLPKDLKDYLDSSTNGVIYMSFGTNVSPAAIKLEQRQVFLKVFSQLPYNILWKWGDDVLEGKSSNIKIGKWFPQWDVLTHPNVKLFITQGGLQSTDEAISAAVPVIGIPMLADQWYNVEKYVYHKIGLRLDLESITEENLKNAINTVIGDPRYKSNIERLRTQFEDQPQTALERAVWWTEHVLRHSGARHLRSPAANISWAEYFEIQLVLVILAALLSSVSIIVFITCYLFKKIRTVKSKLKAN